MPIEPMELLEEPKEKVDKKAEKEALRARRNEEKERLLIEKVRLKEEKRRRKEEERLEAAHRKELERAAREIEELEDEKYRQQYKSNSFFDRFDKYTLDTNGSYGDVRAQVHNAKIAQWKNKSFSQKVFGFDIKRGFKNSYNKVKRFLGMKNEPMQPINGIEDQAPSAYKQKKFDLPDNFYAGYKYLEENRKAEWERNDQAIKEQKQREELAKKAAEEEKAKQEQERLAAQTTTVDAYVDSFDVAQGRKLDPNSMEARDMAALKARKVAEKKAKEDAKAAAAGARKKELERHKEDDAHINGVASKLSARAENQAGGALYRGFNMPYGAGFSAPGPSIADRFTFSGSNNTDLLVSENKD